MLAGPVTYYSRPAVLQAAVLDAVQAAQAKVDGNPVLSRDVLAARPMAFAPNARAFARLAMRVAALGRDPFGRRLLCVGARFGGRRRGELARWAVGVV